MLLSTARDEKPVRLLAPVAVTLVFAATTSVGVRADTLLDSGTTTVSTGTNFGDNLYVGFSGTATLEVISGGSATSTYGYVGYLAGSSGTATVTGGTWASDDLTVGHVGTGSLNVSGGSVTSSGAVIGKYEGGIGTAVVSSGFWDSGALVVGDQGSGSLNVTGGSVTSSQSSVGGRNGPGYGTVTVSSGIWANSADLSIGEYGTGALNVSGGMVTNGVGTSPGGAVVGAAGGNGTVTVSSGTWMNGGDLYVGVDGTGSLNVTGGYVTNLNAIVGSQQIDGEGVGTAVVSSGTWANIGFLIVGWYTSGTLRIAGGSITSVDGYLGWFADSVFRSAGTAVVSGGTWTNSGNLYVGHEPEFGYDPVGSLAMNGGLVTVGGTLTQGTFGTINLNAGGTLQIGTGGTSGVLGVSSLTNNGTLIFNRSDASTYSGVISSTGAVMKQGAGVLTLSGSNGLTGPTTIREGVLHLANAAAVSSSEVTPLAGGTLTLTPYLQTTVGGLNPNAGGLIDVGNGMVTVASGLAATDLVAAIVQGYGGGSWNGTSGITSSAVAEDVSLSIPRAVGWLDNGDGSVRFGYAAPGDTNLDGVIDALDGANFLSGGKFNTGQASAWIEGDFNYDGIVDILDAAVFLSAALYDTGPYNEPPGIAPEPSTYATALAGLACGGYSMWRRRNRAGSRYADVAPTRVE